ncbi:MAG TPA: divalent cation tolerance protein CutA [Candidatus Saccharimonadales bacterium]|nr:divalent cation tolerance protein CutA [Candidatus Saccharimonadales bacterium]
MSKMIIIVTTLHKKEDAVRIGHKLLKSRLIACYNLWPIESAFWWKGKILEENETTMIMKSQHKHFNEVRKFIKDESGYEVPEAIAISPKDVDKSYLNWVKTETE